MLVSIVSIPKSNNKNSPSGYRPISLLSIINKMLEKLILALICDHLAENVPISDAQWGFQKGKSTTTALLAVTQDWFTLLDQGKEIYYVFFDLQKTFDSVPHRRLMEKPEQIHIPPVLLA